MKKTILLAMIIQWALLSPVFSMHTPGVPLVREIKTGAFTSIIIHADVKVELLNSGEQTVRLNGNEAFMENIVVVQKGNNLVIYAKRNRNYTSKGVVYVPASAVRFLHVNSAAHIRSATTLEIPRLDVLVNGACRIDIANKGQLKLAGTDHYGVDYVMRDARFPFSILDASAE